MYPNMNLWSIRPDAISAAARALRLIEDATPGADDLSRAVSHLVNKHPELREYLSEAGVAAARAGDAGRYQRVGGAAVIAVKGVMLKRAPRWAMGYAVGSLDIADAVREAVKDKRVTHIVLDIDTPGGSVDGLAELGDAVYAARQSGRVIAQSTGMIASAGYYLASQADSIYAQRMDMIGSLGTIAVIYDWSGMFEEAGVKPVVITYPEGAELKAAGVPGTEVTDAQRAEWQRIVDSYGKDFQAVVGRGRGWSQAKLDEMFGGKMWMAPEAALNGLVDGVRTLEDTLSEIAGNRATTTAVRKSVANSVARSVD